MSEQLEEPEGERKHRTWVWLLALAIVATLLFAVLRMGSGSDPVAIRLSGVGLEAGWWTEISEERVPSPEPSAPLLIVSSIPSDVLFAEGSSELANTAALEELASKLKATSGPITVEGHTDLHGSDESNFRLGQARADAVTHELTELGVPSERITTRTLGEAQPVCQQVNPDGSDNADCRARCRRVTVIYSAAARP